MLTILYDVQMDEVEQLLQDFHHGSSLVGNTSHDYLKFPLT